MSWLDGLLASLRPGTACPAPGTLHADARAAVPVPLVAVPIRPPPADRSLPRAVRNNNPGNLRPAPHPYPGQVAIERDPKLGDYAMFANEMDGWRELGALLIRYQLRGLNTPQRVINCFAPPSDSNPTTAYVHEVADGLHVEADTPVDLHQWPVMYALCCTIGRFEAGTNQHWHDSQRRAALRQLGLLGKEPA